MLGWELLVEWFKMRVERDMIIASGFMRSNCTAMALNWYSGYELCLKSGFLRRNTVYDRCLSRSHLFGAMRERIHLITRQCNTLMHQAVLELVDSKKPRKYSYSTLP